VEEKPGTYYLREQILTNRFLSNPTQRKKRAALKRGESKTKCVENKCTNFIVQRVIRKQPALASLIMIINKF